jgi:hypothetical protein
MESLMKRYLTIALLTLALVVGLIFNIKHNGNLSSKNDQLNEALMQANLEIGKAHTQFGDAHKYIGELSAELENAIESRDETLTMYGKLLAQYNAKGEGTIILPGAVEVVEVPVESTLEFQRNHFYWAETSKVMQDLGANVEGEYKDNRLQAAINVTTVDRGPAVLFNYRLLLRLSGQVVQTTTESGARNLYFQMWEIDQKGEKLGEVKLSQFEVVVTDERSEKFFWFAPHLDIGAIGGFNGQPVLGGTAGVSLAGYGLTENDLSFRFLRVGATLSDTIGLDVTPVLYNVGGPLPLISNLWVGPAAIFNGRWGGALVLGVVL